MRRPKLADVFQLTGKHGMSRYLSGQSELNTEIQQTGIPNLFVVPSGPVPPNPPELIGSARMSRRSSCSTYTSTTSCSTAHRWCR